MYIKTQDNEILNTDHCRYFKVSENQSKETERFELLAIFSSSRDLKFGIVHENYHVIVSYEDENKANEKLEFLYELLMGHKTGVFKLNL